MELDTFQKVKHKLEGSQSLFVARVKLDSCEKLYCY